MQACISCRCSLRDLCHRSFSITELQFLSLTCCTNDNPAWQAGLGVLSTKVMFESTAVLPAARTAIVVTRGRTIVATWRAIIARAAVVNGLLNHIGGLVINRRRWRRVVNRCWRIHRFWLNVDGPWARVGNGCADNAADYRTYYRRSTPARTTTMGLGLACKG